MGTPLSTSTLRQQRPILSFHHSQIACIKIETWYPLHRHTLPKYASYSLKEFTHMHMRTGTGTDMGLHTHAHR